MTAIRLQRFLSQAGVAARRKAEILIAQGAVKVNGKIVTRMGVKVDPNVDRVSVDGQAVYPKDPFYVLLNKPKACITSVSDPHGRLTVMDYLHRVPVQVAPVGRLDFYSEGVLLLTNDGALAARLLDSKRHVEKTYHVKIRGRVTDSDIRAMRSGIQLERNVRTRPSQVDRLRAPSRHDWLVITLIEGKSRQIHRMVETLGYSVLKLQRVAFAGLTFHGLRVGDARELNQNEVNALREASGLAKNTVARGKWRCRRENTELSRRAKLRNLERQEAELDARGAGARTERRERPQGRPDRPSGQRSGARGDSRGARPGARTRDRMGARSDTSRRSSGPPTGRRNAGERPDSRRPSGGRSRPPGGNRGQSSSGRRPPGGERRSTASRGPSTGRRGDATRGSRPSGGRPGAGRSDGGRGRTGARKPSNRSGGRGPAPRKSGGRKPGGGKPGGGKPGGRKPGGRNSGGRRRS